MNDAQEAEDWAHYDTGPFRRHWDDPSLCTAVCACGHLCTQHPLDDAGGCNECDCEAWQEPAERHPA